jgi:hypothetical protein
VEYRDSVYDWSLLAEIWSLHLGKYFGVLAEFIPEFDEEAIPSGCKIGS